MEPSISIIQDSRLEINKKYKFWNKEFNFQMRKWIWIKIFAVPYKLLILTNTVIVPFGTGSAHLILVTLIVPVATMIWKQIALVSLDTITKDFFSIHCKDLKILNAITNTILKLHFIRWIVLKNVY